MGSLVTGCSNLCHQGCGAQQDAGQVRQCNVQVASLRASLAAGAHFDAEARVSPGLLTGAELAALSTPPPQPSQPTATDAQLPCSDPRSQSAANLRAAAAAQQRVNATTPRRPPAGGAVEPAATMPSQQLSPSRIPTPTPATPPPKLHPAAASGTLLHRSATPQRACAQNINPAPPMVGDATQQPPHTSADGPGRPARAHLAPAKPATAAGAGTVQRAGALARVSQHHT